MMYFEKKYRDLGFRRIAGIDEAGRGTLSGPVVAAAVILSEKGYHRDINDSKKLSGQQREHLFQFIRERASAIGIGLASPSEVDQLNVLEATRQAMLRAVRKLSNKPDLLLIDAVELAQSETPYHAIIKGDTLSISIAAASIIAKVVRDRLMIAYHRQYPHYGFDEHKGYGTKKHRLALAEHGPCPIHRMTFRGVLSEEEGNNSPICR